MASQSNSTKQSKFRNEAHKLLERDQNGNNEVFPENFDSFYKALLGADQRISRSFHDQITTPFQRQDYETTYKRLVAINEDGDKNLKKQMKQKVEKEN